MKQYLLLLKSSDFNKTDNIWTSNPINLYVNSQYKNYSNTRSIYGLNLIGDRTYVGVEQTSPSITGNESTPYSQYATYVTDAGEVVYDPATPDVVRFVDTTSRVDILSYRHIFTNLSGNIVPTFNLTVYESDEEDGPWMISSISSDSNIIFIRNSKPFIKLELEIYPQDLDLTTVGLIFYLEIGIHNITSPVTSRSAKNILKRFPSWTTMFADSIDSTPSLQIPNSVGGKFITSLVQENLDVINTDIELYNINNFIDSANENQIAWAYVSYNVAQNINTIFGDGIQLSRVGTFVELLDSRINDYAFFYSPIDRQLFTIKSFNTLLVNGNLFEQEPINVYNDFDEFGARVGLPRLYLESNSNFKKRILDVAANIPAAHTEGLKRTLRRELDLWRAYGATPDSNYLGATPEILEISDLEISTPYFNDAGIPQKEFKTFVRDLNSKYPSNWGYVKWGEGVFDYAGKNGEGVSRIPAVYDTNLETLGNLYQPGVGDFDDAKLLLVPSEAATISFEGNAKIDGWIRTPIQDVYSPILVNYSWYIGYTATVPDYEASKTGVALVYEVSFHPHGNFATPSVFYSNLNYQDRSDFYVGNRFFDTSEASPEGSFIRIFDDEGMSLDEIVFRDKVYDQKYLNTSKSPSVSKINVYDAASVNLIFGKKWNGSTYEDVVSTDYRVSFSDYILDYEVNPVAGTSIELASPNINNMNSSIVIGSDLYPTTQQDFNTDILRSSFVINELNVLGLNGKSTPNIVTSTLIDNIIFPHTGATPNNLYINVDIPFSSRVPGSTEEPVQGGITKGPIDESNVLIPSSPNIKWVGYDNSSSPITVEDYFDSATINYNATPSYLKIYSSDGALYPRVRIQHDSFIAETTPNLYSGFIDEVGRVFKNDVDYQNNIYLIQDKFLETLSLNRESFGLSANVDYLVNSIYLSATPGYIKPEFDDSDLALDALNSAISEDLSDNFDIYVHVDDEKRNRYGIGVHSGWISIKEEDEYIYVNPESATINGQFFEIELDYEPRMFAPFIARINDTPLRKVAFEDSATPGKVSFWNTELVNGNSSNSLYLAYENLSNISIKDLYTGYTLFTGLSTSTNVVTPFDEATPSVSGREYEIIYYVNDAFYVDKDEYDSISDTYISKVYFSTTPNVSSNYYLTYEKDYQNDFISSELLVNQTDLSISEGFIYLTKDEFNFDTAEIYVTPKLISDNINDLIYVSIISYDENGNFKPYQTFRVYGNSVTAEEEYVTTNANGFATTIMRYSGPTPAVLDSDTIYVEGIGSATPNGHVNSETAGFWNLSNYEIQKSRSFDLKLRAVPGVFKSETNDTNIIGFQGIIEWKDKPFMHEVNLAWSQARTIYDLFSSAPTNNITTNIDGTFVVDESLLAHAEGDPGHWFVRIEIIDTASTISSMLALDGETINPADITITGDIIYWNERYDSVEFSSEEIPLPYTFIHEKQANSDLISTPNFVYQYYNNDGPIFINATPNWEPSQWVPIRRFDQYQMQIFGTTPNYIADYGIIHPDDGEE